ncbi:MAG: FAD-binding dehydrogenase [Bacteroidota bacterium]
MEKPVLIIGGGIAGISAAIELLDRNQAVIMFDRDTRENLGGLARWSMGGLFFVNSPIQQKRGIKDHESKAMQDWEAVAAFGPDDYWPRKWAETYISSCTPEVYEWVTDLGVRFIPSPQWVERGLYTPGNSVPRFHVTWGLGQGLIEALTNRLFSHPNLDQFSLHNRCKVTDFTTKAGHIKGIRGINEANGEEFEQEGGAVIVATGGLTGNLKLLRANWHQGLGTPPPTILNGGHKFGDGLLHMAAEKQGANLTHLDKIWMYAGGVKYSGNAAPYNGLSLVPPKSALWLNAHGERIGPLPLVSGYDTRQLVEAVCQEPRQYSWQVMNMKIAAKELRISGSEYNEAARERRKLDFIKGVLFGDKALVQRLIHECEDIVVAPTVDELARKMNALIGEKLIDPSRLQTTISSYDLQTLLPKKLQNDEQLRRIHHLRQYFGDKLRTCSPAPILRPSDGPLIAIREFILARKTLGGIQTNLNGEVLTEQGTPISGLFAIGEAAGFGGGGIHGLRSLEGTFLGSSILTGRVTGAYLAGQKTSIAQGSSDSVVA